MAFGDCTLKALGWFVRRRRCVPVATAILLAYCLSLAAQLAGPEPGTLGDARNSFKTTLTRKVSAKDVPPIPPKGVFSLEHYKSPAGNLAAYVTPDPKDGKKHPAIVWITGGTCNTIGDVWTKSPPENDQTAAPYREAGIVMMFPSLRGGNEGRGVQEGFYGEVDDVIAAAGHLAKLSYVDPDRVYLGGHSTGGTLVLLVAQCSNPFRAVISFGPVGGVLAYQRGGAIELPFDTADPRELKLRSPLFWMDHVQTPTYVLEGFDRPGNAGELKSLEQRRGKSTAARCVGVKGVNHFSILAPANKVLAGKILADKGEHAALDLTAEDLNAISPGAGDALATPAAPLKPQAPKGGPAIPRKGDSGEIEWKPLAGAKGDKTLQTVISKSNRMSGLVFELTDAGQIRAVAPVTLKDKPPGEKPNQKVIAGRAGYVLYGVRVDAKEKVNAIRLVFVRLKDDRIAPDDTYESDWVGTPKEDKPVMFGCNGTRVVGFEQSMRGDALSGFSLALREEAKAP